MLHIQEKRKFYVSFTFLHDNFHITYIKMIRNKYHHITHITFLSSFLQFSHYIHKYKIYLKNSKIYIVAILKKQNFTNKAFSSLYSFDPL